MKWKHSWLPKEYASLKNYMIDRVPKKKNVLVNFSRAVLSFGFLDF